MRSGSSPIDAEVGVDELSPVVADGRLGDRHRGRPASRGHRPEMVAAFDDPDIARERPAPRASVTAVRRRRCHRRPGTGPRSLRRMGWGPSPVRRRLPLGSRRSRRRHRGVGRSARGGGDHAGHDGGHDDRRRPEQRRHGHDPPEVDRGAGTASRGCDHAQRRDGDGPPGERDGRQHAEDRGHRLGGADRTPPRLQPLEPCGRSAERRSGGEQRRGGEPAGEHSGGGAASGARGSVMAWCGQESGAGGGSRIRSWSHPRGSRSRVAPVPSRRAVASTAPRVGPHVEHRDRRSPSWSSAGVRTPSQFQSPTIAMVTASADPVAPPVVDQLRRRDVIERSGGARCRRGCAGRRRRRDGAVVVGVVVVAVVVVVAEGANVVAACRSGATGSVFVGSGGEGSPQPTPTTAAMAVAERTMSRRRGSARGCRWLPDRSATKFDRARARVHRATSLDSGPRAPAAGGRARRRRSCGNGR